MSINAYLTANTIAAYTARHEQLEGVNYLVAPVVLLVEGVHAGSAGPVFYPLNELSTFPGSWDGRPVTLHHPEIDGQPVGASTLEAIKQFQLGMLLNTSFDPQLGGLRSEVWLDIARARRIAPEVLEAMQKGESIEVSTGLWFEAHGGPGIWGNEQFETTAMSFRPDHLALLPGAVGACSVSDGCGLRANKEEGGSTKNVRTTARRPSFDDKESVAWSAPSWAEIIRGYNNATGSSIGTGVSVADAPQTVKNWAARLSLLGDENADNLRDLMFFPVVNPVNHSLNESALRAVLGGRGSQADITAPTRDSAQALARRLLNSEFDAGLEVERNMAVKDKGLMDRFFDFIKNEPEPKEVSVARLMEYFAINQPGLVSTVRALQRQLDGMDREGPDGFMVHWLEEAFDDGTFVMRREGPDGTKFFKGTFTSTDNEDVQVVEGGFIEVRERKEFVDVINGESQINNEEEENVSDTAKKTLVDNLIGCGKTAFNETHRTGLMSMDDAALEALKAPDAPQQHAAAAPAAVVPAAPAGNEAAVPKTLEESVAALPEEYRETVKAAIETNNTRKEEAITVILAAPGNAFVKEDLITKNLKEVEAIEALVKGNKEGTDDGGEAPEGNQGADFSGKAPATTAPGANAQGDEPLGRPIG